MASSWDHAELMSAIAEDGLTVREVVVPTRDVVYVKSILEAYPGLASVHAEAGRTTEGLARLAIATTRGLLVDLDAVLADLSLEAGLRSAEPATTEGRAITEGRA